MPADRQPVVENEIATVGLPDLRNGKVRLICATIYCSRYDDGDQAARQARWQLDWYRRVADEGLLRLVKTPADMADEGPLGAILLMEGADPITGLDDVKSWHDAGLRIVGLARNRTRYAGSNDSPGPLTDAGRRLARELDRVGMIFDASHLAEEAFWQLLDLISGPVIASHSNCRAIVPGERQLSDAMIRAIARRNGVIGINFYDKFLLPPDQYGKRRARLADVVDHVKHMCDVVGSAAHVGLGTDMDGGLGREQIPVEIRTSADLPRVADALSATDFSDQDILGIMGTNWGKFFSQHLH